MAKRVSLSGDQLGLWEIAKHHNDIESSLTMFFGPAAHNYSIRFAAYTSAEVAKELVLRLDELDLSSSLTVLAAVEAAFRIDYLQRCYRRGKDPVSRALREIYRLREYRASLEDEIFEAWALNASGALSIVSELRGAFKFRHWLAHGRYWTPRLGRRYNFHDVFALAHLTFNSFPFFEVD